jgi:hypothetical protein
LLLGLSRYSHNNEVRVYGFIFTDIGTCNRKRSFKTCPSDCVFFFLRMHVGVHTYTDVQSMFKDSISKDCSAFSAFPVLMGIRCTYFHIHILTNKQIYGNINRISKIKKKNSHFWEGRKNQRIGTVCLKIYAGQIKDKLGDLWHP